MIAERGGRPEAKGSPRALVPDPDALVADCRTLLRRILYDSGLEFKAEKSLTNKRYTLSSPAATIAEAGHVYPVVLLANPHRRTYWLGLTLDFGFELEDNWLSGISVLVFEGSATDQKKSALIRAEWTSLGGMSRKPHAQPHWHVFPKYTGVESHTVAGLSATSPIREIGQEESTPNQYDLPWTEWDRAEKFHFAMAALWHEGKIDSHHRPIRADQIENWLLGCLVYTRDQIAYLER